MRITLKDIVDEKVALVRYHQAFLQATGQQMDAEQRRLLDELLRQYGEAAKPSTGFLTWSRLQAAADLYIAKYVPLVPRDKPEAR